MKFATLIENTASKCACTLLASCAIATPVMAHEEPAVPEAQSEPTAIQKIMQTYQSKGIEATKGMGDQLPQVTFSPLFADSYMCNEHSFGSLWEPGDAFGQDCMIVSGVNFETNTGFMSAFSGDGMRNEDWYSWNQAVLSPISGTVISTYVNPVVNAPGMLGKGRATSVFVRSEDGIVAVIAHLGDVDVTKDQNVDAGDRLGTVGNNGQSRNPHIHVGAIAADGQPAQIRWDLVNRGILAVQKNQTPAAKKEQ